MNQGGNYWTLFTPRNLERFARCFTPLRFGKALDIGKYRLVAFGRFRGTRLAGHRYQKPGACLRRSRVLF